MTQPHPNELLRAARERSPSRLAPGDCMSRRELAEAVNAHLWRATGKRYDLDAHAVARYERGAVRWPGAHYRSALRHVLAAETDSELGFGTKQAANSTSDQSPNEQMFEGPWSHDRITTVGRTVVGDDLANTRRQALAAGAVLAGSALTGPLQQWLLPLAESPQGAPASVLSESEVEALEAVTEQMRDWSGSANVGLGRQAVVAQLSESIERLRGTPEGP
jgi:hypothetical protein